MQISMKNQIFDHCAFGTVWQPSVWKYMFVCQQTYTIISTNQAFSENDKWNGNWILLVITKTPSL